MHALKSIPTPPPVQPRSMLPQELLEAQAREALAAGVVHDLNNFTTLVATMAAELAERTSDPLLRRDLQVLQGAARRAGGLARSVLAPADAHRADREPVELEKLASEVLELLRRTAPPGVALEIEVRAAGRRVAVSASELCHALWNLCSNAIDAMPDGGCLKLLVADGHRPSTVTLSVIDAGHGMSAEAQARAGISTFTSKGFGRGTGLGLASVRRTVAKFGGSLDFESREGLGTVVRLTLPRAPA